MSSEREDLRLRRYDLDQFVWALVALANCKGNVSEAARLTGVPRSTLAAWRTKYPTRYAIIRDEVGRGMYAHLASNPWISG